MASSLMLGEDGHKKISECSGTTCFTWREVAENDLPDTLNFRGSSHTD